MNNQEIHTPTMVLLDLYKKVYGIPYTLENKNSMHDLCFLMNEVGFIYGDDSFELSIDGPKSIKLEMQMYDYFKNPISELDNKNINYRDKVIQGIEQLRKIRENLNNASFTQEEIDKNIDIVYFMNAIAIAKYVMLHNKNVRALDLLNRIRPKKDVNEIAVVEAEKLHLIV